MAKAESDLQSMLAKGMDPRDLPWYEADLAEVPEPAKTILENYSHISPDQVLQHVMDMVSHAIVFDGVPSENLYASDLREDFFDIGYGLFADRETLKAEFITADIFDDESDLVKKLTSKIDIVNAASFFHLFNWDKQVIIAKRLVSLLNAQPGSLVIGRQVGCIDPVDPDDKENTPPHYRHDPASWKRLWEQVMKESNTNWEVESWMEGWEGADKVMKGYHEGVQTFKLRFVVRRV
ncbi:hypothetical protein N7495_006915 [Penicillium taxi]|uniref:uncharacterized protein n=1 Tax=Penicillium taxi TaxID=168475 RepID=UPI0025458721|nr:uncharacterized protein N7495_006915 [Penicillium taxi]KAJ5895224.1 hypothetical protein N7495_006915 [Penicillium taxi]